MLRTIFKIYRLWTFVGKPKEKMFWWYSHLGNMIGSYIAAWTAFSVTTLPNYFGSSFFFWLWPVAVGVPSIVLTTIYYKRKFVPKQRIVAARSAASMSRADWHGRSGSPRYSIGHAPEAKQA